MSFSAVKLRIRRFLDFILTFIFFANLKLLLRIAKVKGLISYLESEFLFRCARDGKGNGLIVEIGSYREDPPLLWH